MLVSDHLIELITRLHQTLMDTTAQALPLHITDQYGWGGGVELPRVGPAGWGKTCRGGPCRVGQGGVWGGAHKGGVGRGEACGGGACKGRVHRVGHQL